MMRFKNAIGGNKNVTPKGCFFIKDFALRAIFLPLPLTSELDALFGGNANLLPRLRLENKVEPVLDAPLRKTKKPLRRVAFSVVEHQGLEPWTDRL